MTDELEKILKQVFMVLSKYYPGICLERLGKTMTRLIQGGWCRAQNYRFKKW
jgi:hypothetical protein